MDRIKWIFWPVFMAGIAHALMTTMYDPDLWWHLSSGLKMIDNKEFLRTDPFSHTLLGQAWLNFEWLSQIGMAALFKINGFWALFWAKVILGVLIIWVLALAIWKTRLPVPLLLFFLWWGFKILQPRLLTRPALFTLLFMGVMVWIIIQIRSKDQTFLKWLPVFFAAQFCLWANLHGGFIYGLGLLFLFWVGAYASGERAVVKRALGQSLAAGVAGTLLNPEGISILWVHIEHLKKLRGYSVFIEEWISPTVDVAPYFWALFVASAGVLGYVLVKRIKRLYYWIPAVFIFAVWGTLSYRNTALLGLIAIPFLTEFWVQVGFRKQLPLKAAALAWGLCLVPITALACERPFEFPADPVRKKLFPFQACEFMRVHQIKGHLFNPFGYGGFMGWYFGGEKKVFMDGRYIFLPLMQQVYDLDNSYQDGVEGTGWEEFFETHKVDHALVKYPDKWLEYDELPFPLSSLNAMFPRDQWALVFWDDYSLLYLKRAATHFNDLIDQYEYQYLRPYNLRQMKFLMRDNVVSLEQAQQELMRHQGEVPFSYKRHLLNEIVLAK